MMAATETEAGTQGQLTQLDQTTVWGELLTHKSRLFQSGNQ